MWVCTPDDEVDVKPKKKLTFYGSRNDTTYGRVQIFNSTSTPITYLIKITDENRYKFSSSIGTMSPDEFCDIRVMRLPEARQDLRSGKEDADRLLIKYISVPKYAKDPAISWKLAEARKVEPMHAILDLEYKAGVPPQALKTPKQQGRGKSPESGQRGRSKLDMKFSGRKGKDHSVKRPSKAIDRARQDISRPEPARIAAKKAGGSPVRRKSIGSARTERTQKVSGRKQLSEEQREVARKLITKVKGTKDIVPALKGDKYKGTGRRATIS